MIRAEEIKNLIKKEEDIKTSWLYIEFIIKVEEKIKAHFLINKRKEILSVDYGYEQEYILPLVESYLKDHGYKISFNNNDRKLKIQMW